MDTINRFYRTTKLHLYVNMSPRRKMAKNLFYKQDQHYNENLPFRRNIPFVVNSIRASRPAKIVPQHDDTLLGAFYSIGFINIFACSVCLKKVSNRMTMSASDNIQMRVRTSAADTSYFAYFMYTLLYKLSAHLPLRLSK